MEKEQKQENQIWLSVSEAAKIGGIKTKTIRRALQSKAIKYRVLKNRYSIEFLNLIKYLKSKTKLKNKLETQGMGQYVEKWKEDPS